jgi:hypothetical protein
MCQQATVWHHDGLRFHAVVLETTERGMAGACVDARGYATWMHDHDVAEILSGLNDPVGTTP